jgi:hypothetical protein
MLVVYEARDPRTSENRSPPSRYGRTFTFAGLACDLWRRLSDWGRTLAKDLPWFPFYPADWLTDVRLRTCSANARGIWIDMICVMDKSERRGYLEVNGRPMDSKGISRNIGESLDDVERAIAELELAGVLYREPSGTMYCKRMVEDTAARDQARQNGRRGGNPRLVNPPLNPEVNPPVNPVVGNGLKPPLTLPLALSSASESEEGAGETNGDPVYVMLADAGFKPSNALTLATHANATPERVRWLIAEASKAGDRIRDPIAFIRSGIYSGSVPQQASDFRPSQPKHQRLIAGRAPS